MKTETTYSQFDLEKGVCTCCGEETEEILIDDGRCVDCIEEEKFYEKTMESQKDHYKHFPCTSPHSQFFY